MATTTNTTSVGLGRQPHLPYDQGDAVDVKTTNRIPSPVDYQEEHLHSAQPAYGSIPSTMHGSARNQGRIRIARELIPGIPKGTNRVAKVNISVMLRRRHAPTN
jgi:hypothetical protein